MEGAGLKYSGYYNGPTTIVGLNTSGGRWSASVSSTDHAYRLDVYTSGRIEPRQTGNKQLGRSVRCVRVQYISPDCNAERTRSAYYRYSH